MVLYIIKTKQYPIYKIGISENIAARLHAIRMSSPIPLTIEDVFHKLRNPFMVEKKLHEYFKFNRSHGEWFKLDKGQVKLIKKLVIEFDGDEEKIKLVGRNSVKYDIDFMGLINEFLVYFNDTDLNLPKGYRKRDEFIKNNKSMSPGNFALLLSIHKKRPELIDLLQKGVLTINSAYQLTKHDLNYEE
jgi:hypothetical protein